MFLSLVGADAAEQEPPAEPLSSVPAVSSNPVSQMPARAESSPVPSPKSDKPTETAPGEFTQLFREGATSALPPDPVKQSGGDFTRIFVQIPRASSADETPPLPPAVSEMLKVRGLQGSSTPSKSVGSAQPNPEARNFSSPGASEFASGSGSFTQVFQTSTKEPVTKRCAPEAPPPDMGGENTKIFQTPGGSEGSSSFGNDQPFHFESKPLDAQSRSTGKEFGITKLMQALSEPEAKEWTPTATASENSPVSPPPAQNQAAAEGLTSLSQRLSDPSPMAPSPSATILDGPMASFAPKPAVALEPGEYTRIISGGMRREAAPSVDPRQEKTRIEAKPQSAFPAGVPVSAPHVPATNAPPIPAAPQPAAIKMPASSKSKLQEYLPILLILNAFLMLVVIFLVIFAFRSH